MPEVFSDVTKAKAELRQYALKKRAGLSGNFRARASRTVSEQFLKQVAFSDDAVVALYWPIGDELDCKSLVRALQGRGTHVCLPVIAGRGRPLVFRLWDGSQDLVPGPFGTREPGKDAPGLVPDIIVLPLLAFDSHGNRLGYGKGYYDRTIAGMKKEPLLAGLAFSTQEIEHIPVSPLDVPLHMVVTEEGVRRFNGEGEAS